MTDVTVGDNVKTEWNLKESYYDYGGKSVLQQSNFDYKGAFYMPQIDLNDTYFTNLTHRYVNGNLKLYSCRASGGDWSYELIEFDVPTLKTSDYNYATGVQSYGSLCDGKNEVDVGGTVHVYSLFWNEANQRMYWTYMDIYYTGNVNPCLGYSTLDDDLHTATGVKAVRMPTDVNSKIPKGITLIPSWFADQYLGGYQIGVGFGGDESTHAAGPVSMGPTLVALDEAEITSASHKDYLSNRKIIMLNTWHSNGKGVSPQRAKRDKDYYIGDIYPPEWNPNAEEYGWWNTQDYMRQSGIWIDTIDAPWRTGFVVFPDMTSRAGATGIVAQSFAAIPAPTSYSGTMNGALPGLTVGETVGINYSSETPGQPGYACTIQTIDGNAITWTRSATSHTPDVPGTILRGDWYGEGTPHRVHGKHQVFVVDPIDMAQSVGCGGTTSVDEIPWKYNWHPEFPDFSYYLGAGTIYTAPIWGVTFDSTTRRLYVQVHRPYRHIVYVYEIT